MWKSGSRMFFLIFDSRYKRNNVYAIDYKDANIITLDSNRDAWFVLTTRVAEKNAESFG